MAKTPTAPQDLGDQSPEAGSIQRAQLALLLSLLAVGASLRIAFFFLSVNNGGDAIDRVLKTQSSIQAPGLQFFFGGWLPLHFWLIAGFAKVITNVELAGRMLSLVLGIASLPLMYRLVVHLFNRSAALISLFAFSFYSLHVGYSTTSSSDVPYLFFLLLGLSSFFAYRQGGSLNQLALAGGALTCAAAIRYEAWIVIFAVSLILVGKQWSLLRAGFWKWAGLRPLVILGVTAAFWPALWMVTSWRVLGHPLYYVAMNRTWVAEQQAFAQSSDAYRLLLTPSVLLLSLSLPVLLVAAYGFWASIREKRGLPFSFLVFLFGFVQFLQIVSGGVMPFARYTLTMGTFLIVLAGLGIERASSRFFPFGPNWLRWAFLSVVVLNFFGILILSESSYRYADKFASISPRLRYARHIQQVGDVLRQRLRPQDNLVIDNHNLECTLVGLAAGLPLNMEDRVYKAVTQPPQQLRSFMHDKRPRFVVYSDRGTLRAYLPLPSSCSDQREIQGMRFHCVYQNAAYRVYEVEYE